MGRDIRTVGVVGLGTMGAGIVEVFARNGLAVVAVEVDAAALDRGRAILNGSTDRAVARGKLTADARSALLAGISFAVGLPALRDVDLVVEAVPERLDVKRALFAELDRRCRPDAILATNTSSLSVTEIAVATGRPEQVVGLHFFNPAPVMRLVEVVHTVVTSPEVVAAVRALCARLDKVDVTIADRAGFVANALLFGYLNHAVSMLDTGYATRDDIDTAMRLGGGLPMGPFALLDLIGLDTAYQILDTMYRRGGRDRRHAPSPLLRQMVTAGLLGRKTGRGFHTYAEPGSPVTVPDESTPPPGAAGAETAGSLGVVGSGALAGALVEAFAGAGRPVVSVAAGASSSAEVRDARNELVDADLVVVVCGAEPVIDVAMATGRPADVVGLHVGHRAAEARLVEVVRTVRTSPRAVAAARRLVAGIGLVGVVCADRAGFIVDALLAPYLNDAVRMLEAGYASADDIDHAMTLGCGYPTGPFELLDALGLDAVLAMQRRLYREVREPGLAPAPLLEQLVTAGRLGRKTGRGVRDHDT